jgi:hypothetical integral membrane protein (TIGR02206 family)
VLDTFRPFSWMHAATLAALLGVTLAAVVLRRRRHHEAPPAWGETAFAVLILALWVGVTGWRLLPGHFDPRYSFPLQLCNLTSLAVPLVLLTSWRPLRAVLYFWGLALSSQGIVTPDLKEGPGRPGFWVFWIFHGTIIGTALYDLVARRFRPTWKDFRYAYAAAWAYLIVALALDLAFGWNYGYVGRSRPDQPSIIDVLGPWPQRLVPIILLVSVAMLILLIPWEVGRSLERRREAARPAGL